MPSRKKSTSFFWGSDVLRVYVIAFTATMEVKRIILHIRVLAHLVILWIIIVPVPAKFLSFFHSTFLSQVPARDAS